MLRKKAVRWNGLKFFCHSGSRSGMQALEVLAAVTAFLSQVLVSYGGALTQISDVQV